MTHVAHRSQYNLPAGFPDRFTSAFGEDRFGIWSEVEIAGVHLRFRWIVKGEFVMGSPADELERCDNEMQHGVILSEGFWLADSACTQRLWRTVMEDNPSLFDGEFNPVENVSWEDCSEFIARVNNRNPLFRLALPTEAQWEYACRSSASTPFSSGQNMTSEIVNFNGEYPYANGRKGIYRKQTVEVKSLPANRWGLYEMHGNVWEWCADWYGEYSGGEAVDPAGADSGDSRVLRGGSWLFNGGRCRSSYRGASRPDLRGSGIGFRLLLRPVV